MRTQTPQQQRRKVIHVNHFQSLILARVQCIAQCTSSPIINSQAAELINSYRVIWTAISQLVLHNSGALLNQSVPENYGANLHSVLLLLLACTALHCTYWDTPASSATVVYLRSTQATSHFKQLQPGVQCFQYFCFH